VRSRTISPAFGERSLVNFGPLSRSADYKLGQGPPQKFYGQTLKIGLKIPYMHAYTFGVVGVSSRNITRGRDSRPG